MPQKLAIIVWSGSLDKLYPVAFLASTAASMGWDVELFFTFWGLNALRKDMLDKTPPVTSGYSKHKKAIKEVAKKVGPWYELLRQAKSLGNVKIYACSAVMEMLGIDKGALADFVDEVIGVATFLERAKDASITLFI